MSATRKFTDFYEYKFPTSKEKGGDFADFILNSLAEVNDSTILTISYNAKDGIGDYVNQIDFTSWTIDLLKDQQNIKVASLSILEKEKFNLGLRLMPDNVKNNGVSRVEKDSDIANISALDRNVFLSYEVNVDNAELKHLVAKADLILNVARYFWVEPTLIQLLANIDSRTLTYSLGEYGPLGSKDNDSLQDKVYYENCMGVRAQDAGIKIYPDLQTLCQQTNSDKDRAILLSNFENKSLLNSLIKIQSEQEYIQSHDFAFGYIQNKAYSKIFARLMVAKGKKSKGVTIVADASHFDNVLTDTQFKQELLEAGYSQICILTNSGEMKSTTNLNSEIGNKVLTIIDFRGTSQNDKDRMIAMADMVAGSGNSSFSEMISSRRLPFLQPIRHVIHFYDAFIAEMQKIEIDQSGVKLLARYLQLNIDAEGNEQAIKQLKEIVSGPESDKMVRAWKQYCDFLALHRNAYDSLIEMLSTFAIAKKLMSKNDKEDLSDTITRICRFCPSGQLSGTTILHLAIENNLGNAFYKIIEQQPALIDSTCIYKNFTPLMLAARYKQYEQVEFLLQNKAAINTKDSQGLTIIHQAVIKRDIVLLKLLAQYHPDLFSIKDSKGSLPIVYAIEQKDTGIIQFLLALDKNEKWKNASISSLQKISILNYAATMLQPEQMHLFGVAKDSKDILSVAQFAVTNQLADLFSKCCKLCNSFNKEAALILRPKFKELAENSGNILIAANYIKIFNEPIREEVFVKFLPLIIKASFLRAAAIEDTKKLDLSLQLELLRIYHIFSKIIDSSGTAIRSKTITEDANFLHQIAIALEDCDNSSKEKKIARKVYMDLAQFCLDALVIMVKKLQIDAQVTVMKTMEDLKFILLKNKMQDFLESAIIIPDEHFFSFRLLDQNKAITLLKNLSNCNNFHELQELLSGKVGRAFFASENGSLFSKKFSAELHNDVKYKPS